MNNEKKHPEHKNKTGQSLPLFNDPQRLKRYGCALVMILLMTGIAGIIHEKEVLFPEMAALTIGMWIVDKRVWQVTDLQLILLMTICACAGVLIVRYSPFPLEVNVAAAFLFAGINLHLTRSSLFPVISACVLPVLLTTESWVYPVSVLIMTCILIAVRRWMENRGIRQKITYEPSERHWRTDIQRWLYLTASVFVVASVSIYTTGTYLIIPPLLVTYVEFVNSRSGFRNRPLLTMLLLVAGSLTGTLLQLIGYYYLEIPETIVAFFILITLFTLFEWLGKFFAPVGAMALIPMLLPREALPGLPFQVLAGATIFITLGMVFFQQCYKWTRAQLIYCLIPHYLINRLHRNKE